MESIRIVTIFCLLILLVSFSFGIRPLEEFMISTWGAPQDAARAADLRRAGFNTVMCGASELPLCRLHDLKAILFDVTPQEALRLRGDRSVWGYALKDEPENHEFPEIARKAETLRRADPTHPVYVNLGWKADPELFIKIVNPQILSFDDYRWWWNNDFLPLLEDYRRLALASGIPLLFWVEANTGPDSEAGPGLVYPADNMARIRSSVFTALAYGVKGIQWFMDRLIFQGSNLTRAGRDVAAVNAELKNLGPVLFRLQSHYVFISGSGPVPLNARPLSPESWIRASFPEGLLGLFKDSEGEDYVMVVNRGTDRDREVSLGIARRIMRAEILNKGTGEWIPLKVERISKIDTRTGAASGSLSPVQYKIRLPLSRGDGQLIHIH